MFVRHLRNEDFKLCRWAISQNVGVESQMDTSNKYV